MASHVLKCLTRQCSSVASKKYIPRRALMYVPASDGKKLSKIKSMKADCIVIDCEDAVSINRKQVARINAVNFLDTYTRKSWQELGVRVNSATSGFLEEDMKHLATSKILPNALFLPKVESLECLSMFSSLFRQYFDHEQFIEPIRLIIWIESAAALLAMSDLLRAAVNMGKEINLITDAVVFGSDDYCASIGATRTSKADELLFARQYFVTVCKAYNLQAIDLVYIDYKDVDGVQRQAEEGYAWGFTGKQVIHPDQVGPVQKAFLPSLEKLEWAEELLVEFEKQSTGGQGAISFRGSMIDMPLVLQARNIVQIHKHVNLSSNL